MNITSTPFIRNDYWPDYNELNELNGRIDEVENELSLTNINLTDKIENVEGNLNAYISQQNNTVITNNVVVNNINANYATGDFLNFNNVNLDNVYVENLTVNKPVFDITLNTPHIDNITVTGGNIFNTNIVNCEINTDNIKVNNLNVADGFAEKFTINELIINKNIKPITSSAVLGYDATGKVIPVRATYDASFPEDANYLYTDHFGTAHAGTAETEVTASDNLITANAVYNEALNITGNIDNLRNDMNNEFNIVNDNFADIDNNFNDVANNFADIDNNFNAVNNFVNDGFNDVANNFNDVANNFNDVSDNFNIVNNNFADIDNSFNNVNNTANNLLDNVDYLKTALAPLLNLTPANVSGWINSTSPVNIQGITSFVVVPFAAPVAAGSDVGDGAKLNVSGTTATLALPGFQWTMKSMDHTFSNCHAFNQNVQIPEGVTNMAYTFSRCAEVPQTYVPDTFTNAYDYVNDSLYNAVNTTFNQNIKLPSSLTNMTHMLDSTAFNQNIAIPEGVTDMSRAFSTPYLQQILRYSSNNAIVRVGGAIARARLYTGQFNQNIIIPNSVTNLEGTFQEQVCFNQNILIPNSAVDISHILSNCVEFNQNILIPNSVTNMSAMLLGPDLSEVSKMVKDNIVLDVHPMAFNQPDMYIYSQNIANMDNAFNGCHINNIHIPTSVPKYTSNYMYNCLVNGNTGITFPAANIFNDLPVDIEQWPPEA